MDQELFLKESRKNSLPFTLSGQLVKYLESVVQFFELTTIAMLACANLLQKLANCFQPSLILSLKLKLLAQFFLIKSFRTAIVSLQS